MKVEASCQVRLTAWCTDPKVQSSKGKKVKTIEIEVDEDVEFGKEKEAAEGAKVAIGSYGRKFIESPKVTLADLGYYTIEAGVELQGEFNLMFKGADADKEKAIT